jgi:hypothetical protein
MKLRHAAAVLAPLLLAACGSSQAGTSKLTVLLKDAPANLTAAVVTISEIDLVGSEGPIVLSTTAVTTDLLTLANDTATLVKDAVIPRGTYSQLRFVITGGYIEVPQAGGGSMIYASSPTYAGLPEGAMMGGTLQMPSYAQSGLKIDLGGLEVGTDAKVLLVDFDAAQSFGQQAGGSGMWVMHPVCTATEVQLTGTLNVSLRLGTGVTLPGGASLASFTAVLGSAGGTPKTLPLAAAGDGTFTAGFVYLVPGDYTLDFDANGVVSTFTTAPALPATVTVRSGQATPAAFTVTAAH